MSTASNERDTGRAATPKKPEITDGMRAAQITLALKECENKWRQRLPILYYQSAIGLFILVASIVIFFASARAWMNGTIHWIPCVAINAFCQAVIREIEHDLVHDLYFPKHKWTQDLMMAAVWPMLGNVPHPWYRRELHMVHHRNSGRTRDLEERMLGMGTEFGWKRILSITDAAIALQFRRDELSTVPFYNKKDIHKASFPIMRLYYLMALTYFGLKIALPLVGLAGYADHSIAIHMMTLYQKLQVPFTVWILPSWCQTFSRQILSSWMHYYLDFGTKLHEVQVLNSWWFGIFNFYSCNFGNTHVLHHFNEKQTFYIRELCRTEVLPICAKHGVRFNDYGSILRRNSFKRD